MKGSLTYRITGTRGTVHYLGFGSQAGGSRRPARSTPPGTWRPPTW
ncbi:MAG: hypothetical protein M5U19_20880 [Microthrixaceae bacterium]|nr:hypothetical protein [Microthrixaceae bacterium]